MAKYIDADKLKAEIERRYAEYLAKMKTDDFTYYEGMADALDLFEQFVDTLSEEPDKSLDEVDLASEIEAASKRFPEVSYAKLSRIAKRFYELGFKRLDEVTHSMAINLAAEKYADSIEGQEAFSYGADHYCWGDVNDAFLAGATWMAGQGVTLKVTDDTTWGEVNDFIHRNCDGVKEIQIRKKEESK